MRLYKRKDSKFYWYKFEYRDVVYRGSTGLKNKSEASGIAAKARLDVIEGKHGIKRQKAAPRFEDAMAQFLDHAREQHAERPNTIRQYTQASKPLIKTFGKKRLNEIAPDDIEKYKMVLRYAHP